MSRETLQWLNNNILVGNTDQRGNAWWYRASENNGRTNHFPGFIPVEAVHDLFDFKVCERRVAVELPASMEEFTHIDANGTPVRWVVQDDRKAMATDDTNDVLGMFRPGYQGHDYTQWLVRNVETILDADLGISSAGLLRNRGVAWVEVSLDESIFGVAGIQFRPNLLNTTSFDGTIATTHKKTIQFTVCDNTRDIALGEDGATFKIKHSANSLGRVGEARAALELVHRLADDFQAALETEVSTKVSDIQFKQVLNVLVPIPADAGRGRTTALNKQDEISRLYRFDPRCEPWTGTAFGVAQAYNTWWHHVQGGLSAKGDKNALRAERNSLRAIRGETGKFDAQVQKVLADVLK
jgi:phage/plasmid-like protein (TIGR03299 family)